MSEVIFKFIAFGVPALMVLGGILLLFTGYPLNNGSMIGGGWVLAILGALIYVLEIFLGNRSH